MADCHSLQRHPASRADLRRRRSAPQQLGVGHPEASDHAVQLPAVGKKAGHIWREPPKPRTRRQQQHEEKKIPGDVHALARATGACPPEQKR